MDQRERISIILRTKNEERWIGKCLAGVYNQTYRNFEVIIVDNQSSDKTLEKAKQFNIKTIATCEQYYPGRALNIGIRQSSGRFIVCLSGHCIPVNEHWLANLIRNFSGPDVAGVYGRQEPMSFTPDADKRDLAIVFGLDRKVQVRDSFFHNANSIVRRDCWEKVSFDENVVHIEDRVWAQQMLKRGYKIIYEPEASVYHYHGIHQDGNRERCTNVVRILQELHHNVGYQSIEADHLNTVALIPVRAGDLLTLGKNALLGYTIERALESRYVKRVIVLTDNKEVAQLARSQGAETPFIRDSSLSRDYVDIVKVLQYSLLKIEEAGIYPDLVVPLEVTFPFRPPDLLDNMIIQLTKNGFDSVIAAKKENKAIWTSKGGDIVQLVEGVTPRQYKDPTFIELRGLGCVTHPEFLRRGNLLGNRIGIYNVNDPYAHFEVRSKKDVLVTLPLLKQRFPRVKHAAKV